MGDLLNLNLSTPDFGLMMPQLIVFGLAIVLLLADAFIPRRTHYTCLTGLSLVGYAAAMVAALLAGRQERVDLQRHVPGRRADRLPLGRSSSRRRSSRSWSRPATSRPSKAGCRSASSTSCSPSRCSAR